MYKLKWLRLASFSLLALTQTPAIEAADATDYTITEDFAQNPLQRGWLTFGDTDLFRWNATQHSLAVTWDSARANSYFYHPLPQALTKEDSFAIEFDLEMDSVAAGLRPEAEFAFELSLGLLNTLQAQQPDFWRGTSTNSPNLVEFDYFPDTGFGATISPVIVSSNNVFIPSFNFPFELTLGDAFHIAMTYMSSNHTLTTMMTRNGAAFGPIKEVKLDANFTDFQVDAVAISSYNDKGSGGSILAKGVVDNIKVSIPTASLARVNGRFNQGQWEVVVNSWTGWVYTLERTTDWFQWSAESTPVPGTGGSLLLTPTNTDSSQAFYRVRAERKP
jgi:hypothetical protein